jgi:mannose-6-phosphate isomerase
MVFEGRWNGGEIVTGITHQLVSQFTQTVWGEIQRMEISGWPFIVQKLVTDSPLSVQVHPKTGEPFDGEFWCIVDSKSDSELHVGFSRETSRREVLHEIHQGTITSLMRCYQPSAGDCFWIPAGTIHCLGAGLTVLEIRPAEIKTLRLYDGNRQPERPLHLEEGLNAIPHLT